MALSSRPPRRSQLAQAESALGGAKLALQRASDAARRAEERAKAAGAQRLKLAAAQQQKAEAAAEAARAEAMELRFRLRLAELRASAAQAGLASPNPPRHLPQHSPLSVTKGLPTYSPMSPADRSEAASASPCGSSPGAQSSNGDCLTPSPPGAGAGARARKTSSGGARERPQGAFCYVVDADGGGSRPGHRRAVPVVPFRGLAEVAAEGAGGDHQQQQRAEEQLGTVHHQAAHAPGAGAAGPRKNRPPMSPKTRLMMMAEA